MEVGDNGKYTRGSHDKQAGDVRKMRLNAAEQHGRGTWSSRTPEKVFSYARGRGISLKKNEPE